MSTDPVIQFAQGLIENTRTWAKKEEEHTMAIQRKSWEELKEAEMSGMITALMRRCTELEKKVMTWEEAYRHEHSELHELQAQLDAHMRVTDSCPHTTL